MASTSQTVFLEIEAHLTANVVKSDNGMTGVHRQDFFEVEDIDTDTIEVNGTAYALEDLKAKTAADFMLEILAGAVDDSGWDNDEPDPPDPPDYDDD